MYRVALVQNQSEMAHYGYADAQPLLREMGYDVELFTAHNVRQLAGSIGSSFDAIFLGSNSLNDKTIRIELREGEVGKSIAEFLASGGGLLSMHQLGMARESDVQFSFLPDSEMEDLKSVVRPLDEDPTDGEISIPNGTENHILNRYPHVIHGGQVMSACRQFRSLPGLYWHWWEGVNLSSWDTILHDAKGDTQRPLLIATKESSPIRAVFSAVTLDWQRHRSLLENVLRFIVEGRHATAVLYDPRQSSIGFEYLLKSLSSQRFPYRQYALDTNVSELARYVDEGVHTSLMLAPHVEASEIPDSLSESIQQSLGAGSLRLIQVDSPSGGSETGVLRIESRQRFAIAKLHEVELRIQSELRNGYVDGSFWGTAEVLQKLDKIP